MKEDLRLLYTDTMDVYRYGRDVQGEAELMPLPGLCDIPCRLSFLNGMNSSGMDNPRWEKGENPSDTAPLLICAPDIDLHNGDRLVIRRGNHVYEGNIGQPNIYENSQQARLWIRR